ncbi:hypothetical protein [Coleofasciculus sp. G2-EDA-02]
MPQQRIGLSRGNDDFRHSSYSRKPEASNLNGTENWHCGIAETFDIR